MTKNQRDPRTWTNMEIAKDGAGYLAAQQAFREDLERILGERLARERKKIRALERETRELKAQLVGGPQAEHQDRLGPILGGLDRSAREKRQERS